MRRMFFVQATTNYPEDMESKSPEFKGDVHDMTAWVYHLLSDLDATSFVITIVVKEEH